MNFLPDPALPHDPPFVLRGRLITPLGSAPATRFEPDAAIAVDECGLIRWVGGVDRLPLEYEALPQFDVHPLVILPGLVDLHAHLPQIPNAGLGVGLHLLDWLERYIYPLERTFDGAVAEDLAPRAFAEFASLGTTTVVLYGAAWKDSVDAAFAAAEASGIRAVIGRVMMDRFSYRDEPPEKRLDVELRESAELCERWHGGDDGRLAYAFTPRFAVSCSRELLRESAALARATGAFWQTHLSEDHAELEEVARLFPEALDYVDVYERAGGLGRRAILAHGIHLSEREIGRIADTRTALVHCPESNLFLGAGAMPVAKYRKSGIVIGLGSDVAGGPSLSLFSAMRCGAYVHELLYADVECGALPEIGPLDWLRLGTLEGARALGIDDRIGSLETGKEADLIVVDPRLTEPLPASDERTGLPGADGELRDADEILGRLIFRSHPDMVAGAWVRGRRLAGRTDLAPMPALPTASARRR